MKTKYIILTLFVLCLQLSYSCISFRGISIHPDVKTYYIENIQLKALNAPANLGRQFRDALITKINNNTDINYSDTDADIEFIGAIRDYTVSSVAPQANDNFGATSFNRLTIKVYIEYINHVEEDKNWQKNFSFFQDFESNENLNDVEETLTNDIFTQLTEDIFNNAFTDW